MKTDFNKSTFVFDGQEARKAGSRFEPPTVTKIKDFFEIVDKRHTMYYTCLEAL